MTYVLMGLTVAVVGLTVYVGLRMNDAPSDTPAVEARQGASDEQKVLQQGKGLMQAGAHAQAAALMGSYVRRHPRDVAVRLDWAKALWKGGQAVAAERVVDEHLQLTKPTARALWMKGELVRLREFDQFSMDLATALWLPGAPMPGEGGTKYMHYFRRAAEDGVGTNGKTWLRYAMAVLGAADRDLRGHGDLLDRREKIAEEYLNKALAAGVRNVKVLASLGDLALRKDDFERAALMLSEAVQVKPDSFELWLMLAQARKEAGQQDAAARSVDRALAIRRGKEAVMLKAQIELLRRDYAAAAEAFAEAAADPRLRPAASFQAARCYYHLEKYALAMRFVDAAAELTPGNPRVATLRKNIEDERFGPVASEDPDLKFRLRPAPSGLEGGGDPSKKPSSRIQDSGGLSPLPPAGGKGPGGSAP